jgi:hypothetical protein
MLVRLVAATGLLLVANHALAAPTKPKPDSALIITNAREVPATDVAIDANGQTVRVMKPLAPKAKTSVKLPQMTGCMVAIAATFEDDATAELAEFDVCQDRNIRLTD